jgi:fimbrial chaperone protein
MNPTSFTHPSPPTMAGLPRRPALLTVVRAVVCAIAVGALAGPVAQAGVFSVTPVRIFLTPKDRVVAITLVNEGDVPVALQADVNSWAQNPDGSDDLKLTEEMMLAPPIIRLAPKARQVVRLAMLRPHDPTRQLTYRMIIREVPEAGPARAEGMEVPIALALNMPIFISPPALRRELDCKVTRSAGTAIEASCLNTGTSYAQIRSVDFQRGPDSLARFEGGLYILPGIRRTITLNAASPVPGGAGDLKVVFDDFKTQNFTAELP